LGFWVVSVWFRVMVMKFCFSCSVVLVSVRLVCFVVVNPVCVISWLVFKLLGFSFQS
jgi:hypothetical protein